ncbi:MAG: hypothetical protein AAGF95_28160 [Chloroflexota bacterium]
MQPGSANRSFGTTLYYLAWRHGMVVLGYIIITLLFTYPTIMHLSDAIGGQQDALENYWNLWWTHRAVIEQGQNPFETNAMHHPFGIPLYFHTYNILNGLLSLPLQMCCGTAVAYNLLNMFAFVMAGLGAYALVYYLTQRRTAAFIAGLIYAFSPYMAFHLDVGQPFMLSLQWMPFYLLALLKGLRDDWRFLLLASGALLLIGLTDWHYLSYSVTITGLLWLYEASRLRQPKTIGLITGKLALVGGLFALLIAPVLWPMLSELAGDPYARRPIEHSVVHSTDPLAFFLPSIFHPLWGGWASEIFYEQLIRSFIIGGIATLGYVALALALCGVVCDWRRSALFVLLFVVFVILSLGPYWQFNGVNSFDTDRPIPLPYLLFRELPFMDIPRIPSRFIAVVMLALAVLAGIGVAWLWGQPWMQRRSPFVQNMLLVGLAALVLFEYWPRPFRMTPVGPEHVSAFYQQLGTEPDDYAIIDVPHLWKPSMFYQTHHEKPTVGGRISRVRLHPWWDGRFFGPLLRSREAEPEIGVDNSREAWRSALACQNVRYVTFYKEGITQDDREGIETLREQLFADIEPLYEDETLWAYGPLQQTTSEPYWTPDPDEWYEAETNEQGTVFRWIEGDTGSLLAYPCGPNNVLLSLNLVSFAQSRTLDVRLNGELVAQHTLEEDLLTPIEVPLELADGENHIELHSAEPATSPESLGFVGDTRMLSFMVSQVALVPR